MAGIFDPKGSYFNKKDDKSITSDFAASLAALDVVDKANSKFFDLGEYSTGDTADNTFNTGSSNGTGVKNIFNNKQFFGVDASEYSKYGVPISSHTDYNKQRAEEQSRTEQVGKALGQMAATVLGEGISMIGSMPQIISDITRELTGDNAEFTNALMKYGDSIEKKSKEKLPIYRENPNKAFDWGDFAWYADNAASIASSVGMLLPTMGILKGASLLGKAAKAEKFGVKLAKMMQKLDAPGNATKYWTKLGTSAVIMRNGENFKESMQSYISANDQANREFAGMSDAEFSKYKADNPDIIKDVVANGDKPNRENVADMIGAKVGWNTYKIDATNVIFDALQLAPLFKGFKVNTRTAINPTKIIEANAKAAGKTILAKTATQKVFSNMAYTLAKSSPMEIVTEGIEEIVNGVAQKEGDMYAKELLKGKDSIPNFGQRLGSYMADPLVWEQGFWGAMGGAVFSGGTRAINGIRTLRGKTNDTHSTKARLSEIASRNMAFGELVKQVKSSNDNINPFTGEEFIDDEDKNETINSILNSTAYNLGKNAAAHGNINLLIDQLNSPEFAKSMADITKTDINESSELLTNIARKVANVENYYKHAANKIYTSDINPNVKDILISEMVGLQFNAGHYAEKASSALNKVTEFKASGLYGSMKEGLIDSDVNLDDALDYISLSLLKNSFSDTSKKFKNKGEREVYDNSVKHMVNSINSKLKNYDKANLRLNETSKLLPQSAILDNLDYLLNTELVGKYKNDLYEYNKNTGERAKTVTDEITKAAKNSLKDKVAKLEIEVEDATDDDTLNGIANNIDDILKNADNLDDNTRSSLSSLRAKVEGKLNANDFKKGNNVGEDIKEDPTPKEDENGVPTPKKKKSRPKKKPVVKEEVIPTEPKPVKKETDEEFSPITDETNNPITPAPVSTREEAINNMDLEMPTLFSNSDNTDENIASDLSILNRMLVEGYDLDFAFYLEDVLNNIKSKLVTKNIKPNNSNVISYINKIASIKEESDLAKAIYDIVGAEPDGSIESSDGIVEEEVTPKSNINKININKPIAPVEPVKSWLELKMEEMEEIDDREKTEIKERVPYFIEFGGFEGDSQTVYTADFRSNIDDLFAHGQSYGHMNGTELRDREGISELTDEQFKAARRGQATIDEIKEKYNKEREELNKLYYERERTKDIADAPISKEETSIFLSSMLDIDTNNMSDIQLEAYNEIMNNIDIGSELTLEIDNSPETTAIIENTGDLLTDHMSVSSNGTQIGHLMRIYKEDGINYTLHHDLYYGEDKTWIDTLKQVIYSDGFVKTLKDVFAYKKAIDNNKSSDIIEKALDKLIKNSYIKDFINLSDLQLTKGGKPSFELSTENYVEAVKHIVNVITYNNEKIDVNNIVKELDIWNTKILTDMVATASLREHFNTNKTIVVSTKTTAGFNSNNTPTGLFEMFGTKDIPLYLAPRGNKSTLDVINKHNTTDKSKHTPPLREEGNKSFDTTRMYVMLKVGKVNGTQQVVPVKVQDNVINEKDSKQVLSIINDYFKSNNKPLIRRLASFASIDTLKDNANILEASVKNRPYKTIQITYSNTGEEITINAYYKKGDEYVKINEPLSEIIKDVYRKSNFKTGQYASIKKDVKYTDIYGKTHKNYAEYVITSNALVTSYSFVKDNNGKFISNGSPINNQGSSYNMLIKAKAKISDNTDTNIDDNIDNGPSPDNSAPSNLSDYLDAMENGEIDGDGFGLFDINIQATDNTDNINDIENKCN